VRILYHHRTRATDAARVHILEMVRAFREAGCEVSIASLMPTERAPSDARPEVRQSRVKAILLRIPFAYEAAQLMYNVVAVPWLVFEILRRRADFIYERYCLFNASGVIASKLTGRPLVLEVNSPFAIEQYQEREIRALRLAKSVERNICNAASAVITVSGPLRRILIESGVVPSKVLLMPNGVNIDHLQSGADGSALRKTLGLENKIVIGFAGWFRKWHGLEFLVETFAAERLAEVGARLLLIGDGPAMASLRKRALELKVEDSIIFAGPVTHEEIAPYLKVIDIAVQPAANEYCCPMKIIEYMGAAKAIVAPRQPNIQELLHDGHNALLFSPGDACEFGQALAALVGNAARRAALGAAAFQQVLERGLLWRCNAERVMDVASAHRDEDPALGDRAPGSDGERHRTTRTRGELRNCEPELHDAGQAGRL
jgi:glycosyltransferase involved in cell wall biosynthesis